MREVASQSIAKNLLPFVLPPAEKMRSKFWYRRRSIKGFEEAKSGFDSETVDDSFGRSKKVHYLNK
jgi:hypothetical protein